MDALGGDDAQAGVEDTRLLRSRVRLAASNAARASVEAVDLLHAASMVPFVASPRYGRAARVSGGLAAAYAAVALAVAPRSESR